MRVVALGTSSTAASVLGNDLGTPAENTHKFLYEYTEGTYARRRMEEGYRWEAQLAPLAGIVGLPGRKAAA